MSDTGKYCWWMRRKETDAGPLREALTGKQPFLVPFLSFCGLTIPKHSCCSACQGGWCCLQNTQCHQATKTSTTGGWQHLPPEELSMLESFGNQGGVGWDHCSLKDRLESNIRSSEPQQFTARPAPLVLGKIVPSSQSVHAHRHPYGPPTALSCETGKSTRGCTEPDLVLPTAVGGTYKAHQATLLVHLLAQNALQLFPRFPFHTLNSHSVFCMHHTNS